MFHPWTCCGLNNHLLAMQYFWSHNTTASKAKFNDLLSEFIKGLKTLAKQEVGKLFHYLYLLIYELSLVVISDQVDM